MQREVKEVAVVRGIPASYAHATVAVSLGHIDVELAKLQHSAYARALGDLGLRVLQLEADNAYPDCCFVEDQAVIAGGCALITRSGNPSRRGEAEAVVSLLDSHLDVTRMAAPASLDGGDVLVVGKTFFVGVSRRSNVAGVEQMRKTFSPLGFEVRQVPVGDALHLKCTCSSPRPGLVLLADKTLDASIFKDVADIVTIPEAEAYAANTVGVGDSVLMAAGYPRTAELLAGQGLNPIELDTSEIRKGDGALTCMSLLF
jgi:dimethylargininase